MLTLNQKKRLYEALLEDYLVEGNNFHASKRYANQFTCEVHPAIVLNYFNESTPVNVPLNTVLRTKISYEDIITFVTGTLTYDLSKDHAVSISSVVGKVSGAEYTFDSSEYSLASDQITFTGPTYPDASSNFTVTFIAQWVQKVHGGQFSDTLSIQVYAEDERWTEGSKDRFMNGIKIADEIARQLHEWFWFVFDFGDITVLDISPIRNLDVEVEGATSRYRQFDVVLTYMVETDGTVVETIETVITQTGVG